MELYINSVDRNYKYGNVSKILEHETEFLNRFINDYEVAPYEVKMQLLDYFFEFRFSKEDIINLMNIHYGSHYDTSVKLPTKMELSDVASEGHGRDFSYWTEFYRIVVDAATNKGVEFEDRSYSYEEIKRLIDEGIISPIRLKLEKIREKSEDREEYHEILTFNPDVIYFDKPSWASGYTIENPNGHERLIVDYIESQKSYKELLKELKEYTKYIVECGKEKSASATKKEQKLFSKVKTIYDTDFKKKKSKKKS